MKPFNVWSRTDEEIGRLMSNFAETPFTLDGVEFASVEGLYFWLLNERKANRDAIRMMSGIRAKRRSPNRLPESFTYNGATIKVGSPEHHDLIKRAIRAKLEAHPEIARAFVATAPRTIVHETGHPEDPHSEFPHATFCRILTELRDEFATKV